MTLVFLIFHQSQNFTSSFGFHYFYLLICFILFFFLFLFFYNFFTSFSSFFCESFLFQNRFGGAVLPFHSFYSFQRCCFVPVGPDESVEVSPDLKWSHHGAKQAALLSFPLSISLFLSLSLSPYPSFHF